MVRTVGKLVLGSLGVLMGAGLAMAQSGGHEVGASSPLGLIAIGSGLAMGLGAFGAATAQGRASGSALEGIARNPSSRGQVFMPMILGLVFMEFQALLGFLIAFMWLNKI